MISLKACSEIREDRWLITASWLCAAGCWVLWYLCLGMSEVVAAKHSPLSLSGKTKPPQHTNDVLLCQPPKPQSNQSFRKPVHLQTATGSLCSWHTHKHSTPTNQVLLALPTRPKQLAHCVAFGSSTVLKTFGAVPEAVLAFLATL